MNHLHRKKLLNNLRRAYRIDRFMTLDLKTENIEVYPNPNLHHRIHDDISRSNYGFLCREHQRKHYEQRKEKLCSIITEDIKSDIAQLRNYVNFKVNVLRYCDSLQNVISHPNVFQNSDSFYTYSKEPARYIRYYPADRTIEQLKNSGNMQLIRKRIVSNAIAQYYSKTKLMEEVDQELNDEVLRYRRYLVGFLDLSSYDIKNKKGSYLNSNIQTKGNPLFVCKDIKHKQ